MKFDSYHYPPRLRNQDTRSSGRIALQKEPGEFYRQQRASRKRQPLELNFLPFL